MTQVVDFVDSIIKTSKIDLLIDNQSENGQVRFGFEHKKSLGYRKWSGHENSILYLSGKKIIFNDKTILVTGGTGSFGKHFCETLLKNYIDKMDMPEN